MCQLGYFLNKHFYFRNKRAAEDSLRRLSYVSGI